MGIRADMSALSHEELDLVLMSQIMAFTNFSESVVGGHAKTPRARTGEVFYHQGLKICQKMFLFIHGCGRHRYDDVKLWYKNEGLQKRYE
jgi:hypothetical protein